MKAEDQTETSRIDVRVLAAVSLFSSKEETRYYLNGVFLEIEPYSVTYVATDGHRLVAYRDSFFHSETANACLGHFIVPTAQCRVFKCRKDGVPAAALTLVDGILTLQYEDIGLSFPPLDGTFPDWRSTVAKSKREGIGSPGQFDLSLLGDFNKFAKALELGMPFVAHNGLVDPAEVRFRGCDIFAMVMPMRVEDPASSIGIPEWVRSPETACAA